MAASGSSTNSDDQYNKRVQRIFDFVADNIHEQHVQTAVDQLEHTLKSHGLRIDPSSEEDEEEAQTHAGAAEPQTHAGAESGNSTGRWADAASSDSSERWTMVTIGPQLIHIEQGPTW